MSLKTKSNTNYIAACMVAVVVCVFAPALPALAVDSDTQKVKAASTEFYSALNSMFGGDTGPMDKIWSHADDVVYMGPGGGTEVGWTQVSKQWKKQAAMKLGGKVHPENSTIVAGNKLAIVYTNEKGENTDLKGKPMPVSIRATNVFRFEAGTWKMIGHHTDRIPGLSD